MKRAAFILPLFWLLAGAQNSPAEEPVTLKEAVKIAIDLHPDVGKALAAAEGLKGRIKQVRAQALPEINLNAFSMRLRDPSLLNASGIDKFPVELRDALVPDGVNLFDYRLTVKQPIFTAGKVGTALRLASVEAEGASIDIDRAKQDLSLEVVKAFYGLLWTERYRDQVAQTQDQRKQHAAMAKARFDNGVATEVDVLRSEVAVANGTPELLRADNAIRQARALLNFYLVRQVDHATRAAGEFEEKTWDEWDLDALCREAIRRRPELSRLRISERSAGVRLKLAEAESRMRADLSTNYGVMSRLPSNLFNQKFVRWDVSVNFTFPLFDGFKRNGMVEEAVAAERTARLEREKLEQQVRLGIQQGLDEVAAQHQTIAAARANTRQADRVLEMMQNNYKYGAATTLDIVDAQAALATARTNLLRGLHDFSVARSALRWSLGRQPEE